MLDTLLAILGSGTVGSVVGLAGGVVNRIVDLKAKKLDIEDKANQRAHEINMLGAEKEFMLEEAKAKLEITTVESDAAVEQAGYAAMKESYNFAAPTSADGWVDKVSKIVRPLITVFMVWFVFHIYTEISALMATLNIVQDNASILRTWSMIVEFSLFQAGVVIGWWFAMRPGKHPAAHK